MKLRSSLMIAFAATALLTGTAFAHDPALHSKEDEAKAKPATCQQLNDPEHYEIDLKDDSTRSLKARCGAEEAGYNAGSGTPSIVRRQELIFQIVAVTHKVTAIA